MDWGSVGLLLGAGAAMWVGGNAIERGGADWVLVAMALVVYALALAGYARRVQGAANPSGRDEDRPDT